jgi:quercetin 2,3-dioxygenase
MKRFKDIIHIFKPKQKHWVGDGFHVYSMFQPHPELNSLISPFLLMDYAPSEYFPASDVTRGVGEHPHRGFETVTFVYKGEVEHMDSAGGGGKISPGDVQWMTAGAGLVHEEKHSKVLTETGGYFSMVQLWVNLPRNKKMTSPRYQSVKAQSFPLLSLDSYGKESLKLIAGEIAWEKGPCETHSEITLFELDMQESKEHEIQLKEKTNTLMLILEGKLLINKIQLQKNQLAILGQEGEFIEFKTMEQTKILVLNGVPINEPIAARGPFVMNFHDEIQQAFEDYQNGKMGTLY